MEALLDKVDVPANHIYNIDETKIELFHVKGPRVLVAKGQKRVERQRAGKGLKHISFMSCVNAAGEALPPTFLFAGKRIVKNIMSPNAPEGSQFILTDKGYMDSPAYLSYCKQLLSTIKERPLILVTDGHKSRDGATLQCAIDDVHVFQLHSHSTHMTQPLDVAVYPVFKKSWSATFDKFCIEQPSLRNSVDRSTVTELIAGMTTVEFIAEW